MRIKQFQYLTLFLLLLLISLPALVFAQSSKDMVDKLALPLYKSSQSSIREQIYTQLSKSTYEQGEDLWFKAYLLNSLNYVWNEEILKANWLKEAIIFDETLGIAEFMKRLKQALSSLLVNLSFADAKGKSRKLEVLYPV